MVNEKNGENSTAESIEIKDYSFLPYFAISFLDRTKKPDIEEALGIKIFNEDYNPGNGDNRLLNMTQM